MACFLLLNCTVKIPAQFRIAGAGAHAPVEIVVDLGKEAGADFAVRGESHAAAGTAKGLGHRSYDADFADAVVESVATGSLAGFVGRKFNEGQDAADALYNLAQRDDDIG